MDIRIDDLRGPAIAQLLREHLDAMHRHSPPESVHALDLDALRRPEITFWCAWDGETLMGCGALKQLDATRGEVKSMRTASAYLRRGVAAALLAHIIGEARRRGYRSLHLETGSAAAFDAAWQLYGQHGFVPSAPFADYVADPYSRFMRLAL